MNLPKMFFPTNVLIIDDSEEFLQSVGSTLTSSNCLFTFFENPQEALAFLSEYFSKNEFSHSTTLDFFHQKNRNQMISAIIADYRMYPMNGVDFFSQLQQIAPNNLIRKILLTGDDSLQLQQALSAQPIVEKIIKKSEKNLVEYIEATARHENTLFFQKLSGQMPNVEASFPIEDANQLYHLFQSLFRKLKCSEYYWLNHDQDCLMVDTSQIAYRMFFRSGVYMRALRSLLEQSPKKSLYQSLHQRLASELPYALDINELKDPDTWENLPWKSFQIAHTSQSHIYYGYFVDEHKK